MGNRHEIEKIRQEIARKYNSKIKELENEVKILKIEKSELKLEISKLKSEIEHKNENIDLIAKYVNLDKDELDKLISDDKKAQELNKSLHNALQSMMLLYKPFLGGKL